ncbi:hypothetical protein E4H12_07115 [Candidatus Thorarchaeota archaeon]|nr:MAG: hypothetical protein E4H12_07115 [Candidatus Thorarchaeota archaeon]
MSEITRPIHRVADILSRRGQTIYGRQMIVDLCATTGVSLMDSITSDMGEEDSDASLLVFVVSYAKMNPAAKLTVMTLARIHGVAIPKELLEKRRIFADILDSLSEFTHEITERLRG